MSEATVSYAGPPVGAGTGPPRERLARLFLRFLGYGMVAWGGPVAQIAKLRDELVESERWISPERFNRVLAVYQALPGPEATELCVYFGMVSRGRVGGLLAGLGFMLPGFALMFALSWVYVEHGVKETLLGAAFLGFQPAVAALVVRAVHRIGARAVRDPWLLAVAVVAGVATLLGAHFLATLAWSGAAYVLARRGWVAAAASLGVILLVGAAYLRFAAPGVGGALGAVGAPAQIGAAPSLLELLWSGLRTGMLTFGGAYTAIPFLQHDAVGAGGWMTEAQFLDGIAMGGVLPAPLVIFALFVGYIGAGPLGALVITAGVFLPAFAITLIGHDTIERVVGAVWLHRFLDGVTAGVVGLIGVTAIDLARAAVARGGGATGVDWPAAVIFVAALAALYLFRGRAVVPAVVLAAGAAGMAIYG